MYELFVGIDPSLAATGYVVLDSNKNIIHQDLIKTPPASSNVYLSSEQRILDIYYQIITKYIGTCPMMVYIEDVGYMSKDSSLFERVGLLFMIRTRMFKLDVPFKVIAPKSLKKRATGNGNADKKMMMDSCEKRWGIRWNDDNLCDAFSLAMLALEENIK